MANDLKASDLVRIVFVCEVVGILDREAAARHRRDYMDETPSAGISGLLVGAGDRIGGLIEGPFGGVIDYVEQVALDRRHRRLRVLREEPIERRRIGNWSATCLPAEDTKGQSDLLIEDFIDSLSLRL